MEEHHAILLVGSYEWARAVLPFHVRTATADVFHIVGNRMGIDDVRALTREAFLTPLVGTERVFVVAFPEYTHEAQNALLKLLEEPPRTARFYLVTHRADELLPTLRSRVVIGAEEGYEKSTFDQTFFSSSYSERLALITARMAKKDDAWAHALMNAFEEKATHVGGDFRHALVVLRPHFNTTGAAKKMILEHLSLLLPPRITDGA